MNFNDYVVASNDGVIVGGQPVNNTSAEVTNAEVQQPSDAEAGNSSSYTGIGFWGIMGMYALFIAAIYFFMARPQKKKQKQVEEMQNALQAGDDVFTSSGFHGKIISVENSVVIVEFGTNKGVNIPVNKSEVYKIKKEAVQTTSK